MLVEDLSMRFKIVAATENRWRPRTAAGGVPARSRNVVATINFRSPIMSSRLYTQTLPWLTLFLIFSPLVYTHLVEVVAGTKDCFFEDLHKNDQVCIETSLNDLPF